MAVVFRSIDGVVIDHALAVERAYTEVDCGSQIWRNCRLKEDLFDIHSPFKMDSQCQAEKEMLSPSFLQNKKKRKRKRKYDMNHGELEAIQHHSEIVQRLTLAYNNLLTIGRQCGYFPSCPSCKTAESADSKCNYRSERLSDTSQHINTSEERSKERKYISENPRLDSMSSTEPEKAAVIQSTCNINSHHKQDNIITTQQTSNIKGLAKSTTKQDMSATCSRHTHKKNTSVINEVVTDFILTQDTSAIGCRHDKLDNNKSARLASKTEGPGDSLIESCLRKVENAPQLVTLHQNSDLLPDCVNMIVRNDWSRPRVCYHDNHRYIIPHHSVFMMSEFSNIDNIYPGNDAEKFDLIVLDPPWQNKSVKRKKVYGSIVDEDLLSISLDKLASPGCLVVVWVTNKMRHLHFIQESLFPAWSVDLLAEWHWLKVTTAGEMVYDIASNHKKPYETLVIGRYCHSSSMKSVKVDSTIIEHDEHLNYAKRLQIEFNLKEDDAKILSDKHDSSRCQERMRSKELEQAAENSGSHTVRPQHCHLTNTSKEDFCDHPNMSYRCDVISVPPNQVIVSVPCAIHSVKPPLYDVFKAYLKDHPKCLELFARNLWPGVTSWGNEVLRHQHIDFYQHS